MFKRDGYRCVECGASGSETYLNVDHIKPYSQIIKENGIKTVEEALKCLELWGVNNGRTLCVPCHKKTPTYTGKMKKILDKIPTTIGDNDQIILWT